MAIAITRTEHSAAALRREASRTRDADQARRLLALALVLDGASRTDAARACGMDRQTLRDWVHRYNAEGIAGLVDRPPPGRKPQLTAAQEAELTQIVETGPEVAVDGVVRWRRIDLRAVIEARFGEGYPESCVSTGPALSFSGLSALRPENDRQR
jgi:transposase